MAGGAVDSVGLWFARALLDTDRTFLLVMVERGQHCDLRQGQCSDPEPCQRELSSPAAQWVAGAVLPVWGRGLGERVWNLA